MRDTAHEQYMSRVRRGICRVEYGYGRGEGSISPAEEQRRYDIAYDRMEREALDAALPADVRPDAAVCAQLADVEEQDSGQSLPGYRRA